MKRHFFISFFSLFFFVFAQEPQIVLPEVITFIPASVERKVVFTADMLEAEHFETLSDVVERSGIQNLSYGPYGLESKPSIRGFTDETVRVVIDGICVNNAQYGTFDFSSINISSIEKIEIVRGGFTEGVEDEGSVGGVIYITTKKNDNGNSLFAELGLKTFFNKQKTLDSIFQKVSFSGKPGENSFLSASGTFNFADNSYLFKYSKRGSGKLLQGAFGAVGNGEWKARENALVMDGHGNINFSHYFGEGNCVSFGDIFYAGYKNTPGVINSAGAGLQRDWDNNLTFSLWNPSVCGALFNLNNSLAWLCNNRFYREGDAGKRQKKDSESKHFVNTIKYSGTADFYSLFDGRLRETFGVSADYTHLDSTNDGIHNQISGVIKQTTKFAFGKLFDGLITLSVPLAAKFCTNDNNSNFAFVPKAGLCWEFSFLQFVLDFYRMVQFPNMDDLFWEGGGYHGNPKLRPESGWGGDFVVAVRNLPFEANVTVFSNYYKDKIQWGSGTTQNVSSAFYLGVDFSLGAKLFDGLLNFDLNGEYLYNRLLDKTNKFTYGKRIMWTPDFVCTAVLSFNLELAKIRISAEYTGRRYTSNMNLYWLEPYLLVNLSAEGASVGERFIPFLKIDNLLNWQYQAVENYPMPGISLTVGGRFKFF